MSLDTYKLPLYFLAKVKVKKEVICKSEYVHNVLLYFFVSRDKSNTFLLNASKKPLFFHVFFLFTVLYRPMKRADYKPNTLGDSAC